MAHATLTTLANPTSAASEAFRTLRTNLMFMSAERPVSTLLITSAVEGEDKSMVTANLGVAFAQAGNKTIIVDADLRRPAQHEIWGLPNERGLTTVLGEGAQMANPPLQQTSIPDLQVLTSGPKAAVPADLLSHQRLQEVIGLLRARANYILFDSPPVLAATDAALLGVRLDGALLVVRAGSTRRDHTVRARQALDRVHVRLLGAVLTNANHEMTGKYA